jgi:hypothetical protein
MDELAKYFEEVASKNAKLAIASPGDLRLAINAIMSLDGFFGSLHARLREDAKVGEDSDDKWKENLACQNKYYRLLRDAAYALKHGNLTRGKSRVVRRSDQILAVPGAFSSQAFQANAFQTDMVWIDAEDTNYRAHEVIKEVVGFARQVFSSFR